MSITAIPTLKTLTSLIEELSNVEGSNCTVLCMTIDHILDKLDSWAKTSQDAKDNHPCCGSASLYITEMKGPLYSIAGLYDYGHDKIQCTAWLRSGIHKLASIHCFAVSM